MQLTIGIGIKWTGGAYAYISLLDEDDYIWLQHSDEGYEDLCHLWVTRACRHAGWEGELK